MLILRLQSPDDQEFAYTFLSDNAALSDWSYGSWQDIARLNGHAMLVTLLIPTREVLLTSAVLPTTNARQLKQALPYTLEDSLVGELEDQHFVWHSENDSGLLDVAVIDYYRLGEWIESMRQRKLKVRTILPDVFALPWSEGLPTIWQRNQQVWVRNAAYSGFSCQTKVAPVLVESLFAADDSQRQVQFFSDDDDASWLTAINVTPLAEPNPNRLKRQSLESAQALNLLKGYQDKSVSSFNRHWSRWRSVAGIAAFTLTLALGIKGMEAYHLGQQLAASDERNLALFSELFPEVSNVDAGGLRSRAFSELDLLRAQTGTVSTKISPLPYLSTVGQTFQQSPGLKITNIRLSNNRLVIQLEVPNLPAVEQLREALTTRLGEGNVTITSESARGVVRANLTLEMNS